MRWRRSGSLPAEVATRLPLADGERVLAAAVDDDGRWLAGTDRALHREDADGVRTHPWEALERASWDREEGALEVVEVADFGETEPHHVHRIAEPGRLLELVRERITASIVARRPVPVRRGAGITVVVRRSPTRSGAATFAFVLDPDLSPEDPEVRAAVRRGVREVREELGLGG